MTLFDARKDLKHLYAPSAKEFAIADVPPLNFLMMDGHGDPNQSPAYQQTVEALYALSYALKFALKKQGHDYVVSPLEGLWWMEDMAQFSLATKSLWDWTMMIMQPEPVTSPVAEQLRREVMQKKGLGALSRVRFEAYHEGLAVQILYYGAYADEGPTIARLHQFVQEQGYILGGKHHEIYLGDPRRTTPDKLKTVIRQPISRP
jgi:hypothetical protein